MSTTCDGGADDRDGAFQAQSTLLSEVDLISEVFAAHKGSQARDFAASTKQRRCLGRPARKPGRNCTEAETRGLPCAASRSVSRYGCLSFAPLSQHSEKRTPILVSELP